MDEATSMNGQGASRLRDGDSLAREISVAADLAYLELRAEERLAFAESVGRMLEFFEKMDGFAQPAGVGEASASSSDSLRSDEARPFAGPDPIGVAPELEGRFVAIPNIL